ncbi:MAG: hypothetical protein J0M25_00580 [Flavobacteriales bacterium]|nr:hypothetical protein [Flavobacteriales bacterium]
MIVFDYFSKAKLFDDKELNVFFNQIYTIGCTQFTQESFLDNCLIGDYVAKAVQEIDAVNENSVHLYFLKPEIFNFFKSILNTIPLTSFLVTGDEIFIQTTSNKKVKLILSSDEFEVFIFASINFIQY